MWYSGTEQSIMCLCAVKKLLTHSHTDFVDLYAGGDSQPDPAALAREKSASAYMSIISQQTFIGCWKLNVELSQVLDVSLDQLQNAAPLKVSFSTDKCLAQSLCHSRASCSTTCLMI